MDESVLSQIVRFMTDKKLDKKILQDKTYQNLLKKETIYENNLKKMLTAKQWHEYLILSETIEKRSARYHILAYQQGMKDLLQFFNELARK